MLLPGPADFKGQNSHDKTIPPFRDAFLPGLPLMENSDNFQWYKREPQKFIRGVQGLGPHMIAVYSVVLDLIYADEESCPNDPKFVAGIIGDGMSTKMVRVCIEKLIAINKLRLNAEGRLVNDRAEREIESRQKLSQISRENGLKGGRKPAEKVAKRSRKASENDVDANKNNGVMKPGPIPIENKNKKETQNKRNQNSSSDELLFPPEAAAQPSVVELVLIDGSSFGVTQTMIDGFKLAYPAVDVEQNLQAMGQWCIANPTLRKTRKGALRFINAWLAKRQDRAGHIPPASMKPAATANFGRTGDVVRLSDFKNPEPKLADA